MSTLNATATVNLHANGQQVADTLNLLKQRAFDLENAIAKAAAAGNKASLKKLQKELTSTRRQIREMTSSAEQAEEVLKRLDRATPKELRETLRTLNKQLEGIERGTEAWDEQCKKIRQVKEELQKVNSETRQQDGFWDKFNRKMNDWQTTLAAGAAAVTGLVMAGRSAVNAYASLDAEMANVRKFTGMTAEQVQELNKEFENIDTRTSQENLNELAQEAGRLGKTSMEDVSGFVRAADQINVALDDLGEGATLVLSKLTDIFGDEKRLGTEQSLLAVGSVINELSQNCTASAPYLAEFAQRLAGVGAQAKMTIPQIMGYAAVLDSKGQAVEMSATAVSKLIMDMFKDTDKIAKATGMDLDEFKAALDRSTNEGLLMLLNRLKEVGGMDVLAPIFKSMGEDGARASAVISALAGNIETVKWQQQQATTAFNEATSVTKEFNVQNNTVQAGLDKACKGVAKLAAELGEKLSPVMAHVISSTTLILKLMSTVITFVGKHITAIATLTAMFVAYKVAVNASNIAFKAHYAWLVVSKAATTAYTATVKGLHAAHLLLQIGLAKLQGNWARQSALMLDLKKTGAALATGWGILAAAAVALGVGIYKAYKRAMELSAAEKALNSIRKKAAEGIAEQKEKIFALIETAKDETKSLNERQRAVTALNKIIPNYNAQLDKTFSKYKANKKALDEYINSLTRLYEIEGAKDKLKEIGKTKADLEVQKHQAEEERKTLEKQRDEWNKQHLRGNRPKVRAHGRSATDADVDYIYTTASQTWQGNIDNAQRKIDKLQHKIDEQQAVVDAIKGTYGKELTDSIAKDAEDEANQNDRPEEPETPSTNFTPSEDDKKKSRADHFKQEQEWRKQQEAEAKASYLRQEIDYDAFTKKMEDIEIEYYDKARKKKGNNETEQAESETGYLEALKKQQDRLNDLDAWKSKEEALNRIAYATGQKDYEQYTRRMQEIEVEYWQKKMQRTEVSAQELLAAQASYYEALKKQEEGSAKLSAEAETKRYNEAVAAQKQRYVDGQTDYKQYTAAIELLELEHLRQMTTVYKAGSKEQLAAQEAYQNKLLSDKQKREEDAAEERQKIKEKFFGDNADERLTKYDSAVAGLEEVYQAELKAAGDNAAEKLRIEKAFQKAKLALQREYNVMGTNDAKNSWEQASDDFMEWLESDGGKAVTQGFSTLMSGMGEIFSGVSSLIQAELDIETAAIEKRYDAEVSAAEGNSYKVKQLEKQKEEDLAKAKNEANKKMFAMQVIQAVAQTAQNALSAYGSAAAIPMIGYIMAPIAASMAVAAGMIQIAAIKKQQQASEAQGYAEGGFTKPGAVDEPAGIVHAGEWVASQRLVNSPQTRPIINALERAQRTNTLGSLTAADASAQAQPVIIQQADPTATEAVLQNAAELAQMRSVIARLNRRLNEPFVTVNTVTGDKGIQKAQDEYSRLLKNKSPKK